jgi:hypothetical protein
MVLMKVVLLVDKKDLMMVVRRVVKRVVTWLCSRCCRWLPCR